MLKDAAGAADATGAAARRQRRALASSLASSPASSLASSPASISSFVVTTIVAISGREARVAARARNVHDTLSRQTAPSLASILGLELEFLGTATTVRDVVNEPFRPPALPPPVAPSAQAQAGQQLLLWAVVALLAALGTLAACACAVCVLRRQGRVKARAQAPQPPTSPTSPSALASPTPRPSQAPGDLTSGPGEQHPRPLARWGSQTMTTTTTYWSGADANGEDANGEGGGDYEVAPSEIVLHEPRTPGSGGAPLPPSAFRSPEMKLADLRTPRQRTRHPAHPARRRHTPRTREEDLLRDIYATEPGELAGEGRLRRELAGWRHDIEHSQREARFQRQLRAPPSRSSPSRPSPSRPSPSRPSPWHLPPSRPRAEPLHSPPSRLPAPPRASPSPAMPSRSSCEPSRPVQSRMLDLRDGHGAKSSPSPRLRRHGPIQNLRQVV